VQGGDIIDITRFIGKVTAEMKIRGLTHSDLAKMTGYKVSTIHKFMSLGLVSRSRSGNVAKAVSEALKIKL
jgi:DNA-directed RNA polymerase specialized sigma24 family protein